MSLYDTLRVTHHATPDVIQSAYRALARTFHPDINPSAEAASRMQEINAAYAVLMDPDLRAQYDARCARQQRIKRAGRGGAGGASAVRPTSPSTAAPTSQPPTPAAGAIGSSEPTMLIPKQCPRLGFRDDPANRFRKPTQLHACFAAGRAEGVSIYDQRRYCLDSAFVHCPRWVAQVSAGAGAPRAGSGEAGRNGQHPSAKPFLKAVPRAARPVTAPTPFDTRAYRWSLSGTPVLSWMLFAALITGPILAILAALILTFVMVADAVDSGSLVTPFRPVVTITTPDALSPGKRSAQPAAETSTILPWACAFWRSSQGTSC